MPSAAALDHSLARHFYPLADPRNVTQRRHILLEMIVIAIAAVIGGAEGWVAIAQFGRSKEAWFRQFFTASQWNPLSRYLWTGVFFDRTCGLSSLFPRLGGIDS